MSDERRALAHLLLGIEELMRAGAEAAAALRARTGGAPDRPVDSRPSALLDELRAALAREVARWELRGDDDPAARRVRDLFEAILDVVSPDDGERGSEADVRARPEDRVRKAGTRAPRRGVQR